MTQPTNRSAVASSLILMVVVGSAIAAFLAQSQPAISLTTESAARPAIVHLMHSLEGRGR